MNRVSNAIKMEKQLKGGVEKNSENTEVGGGGAPRCSESAASEPRASEGGERKPSKTGLGVWRPRQGTPIPAPRPGAPIMAAIVADNLLK